MSDPSPPGPPGDPTFTNILPTTLTISWTAPTDDGGDPPFGYQIQRYLGDSVSGVATTSFTSGLSKNDTGLTAGQDYTYTVCGVNSSPTNSGRGATSQGTVQTLAGSAVRVDGVWKIAIPYVRVSGVWKMAVPWIRVAGVWTQTH